MSNEGPKSSATSRGTGSLSLLPHFPFGPRGSMVSGRHLMRQYLKMAVGELKAAAEEVESTPITERREFSFVKEQ
jgi:hypothetical protein